MTRKQFDEWVEKMIRKSKNEQLSNDCKMRAVKDVIICVDRNRNVGIAKCHPNDEFNSLIGRAIAYARCKGIEIPKVNTYKKLSEMKNGEMFKDMFGYTYRYIGKNGVYPVSYCLEDKRYCTMPFNIEYEMVE